MREMTLTDIQGVSLDILKHFHTFCQEHAIKYSLGYGTLIGAVRHNGFIPWDDDIDIVMMREDYDRFTREYLDTPDYKLFSFDRGNMYAALGRLCEMKRTQVVTGTPLFTETTGIWIDIFPLDTVPEDRNVFNINVDKYKTSQNEVLGVRWMMRPWRGSLFQVKSFLKWLYYRFKLKFSHISIMDVVKKQNDLCLAYSGDDSNMMSMLCFPVYIDRDFSPKAVFKSVVPVPFEGCSFNAMSGYDQWLRIIYGDYMKLPPIEQQVRAHTIHKYYWL